MAIKNLGVLAFASAAVAAGHGHYQHNRLHARGTGSGAPAAIPTGLPACWGTCFEKSKISSPDALCGNSDVSNCVKATCATEDAASYESWLQKQCNSSAPYPVGNNSTAVGPTATGGYSSAPGGYSTSICTETSTLIYKTTTEYSTYLITHTLSASAPGGGYGGASSDVPVAPVTESASAPGGYGSGSPASPTGGEGEGEECSEVTVTTTERTTVTVTAGEGAAPSSAAPEAPSSYAAPSSPAAPEAPSSYEAPSSAPAPAPTSYAEPSSVSEADAETGAPSSWEAPSSYGGAAPSSEAPAAPSSYAAPSSSSASSQPSSPPTYDSGFRGKRGIAYNDSSMVIPAMMDASKIGWASNWEGIAKGFEHSDITFIPTLHSGDSYWTGMWKEQAEAAISQGLPYLFGPNEPDIPSQANMEPKACADFWREWMEPYAGRIGLVAPSVSSGVGEGIGQAWLDEFMGYCSDCTFDAVNQHWYNSDGNDVENFKDTVSGAAKYGKPVFVGEFGAIGSDEDISGFLDEVMPWMDSNNDVIGYAYFMAYNGLLVNGDALSSYGETYCDGK